MIGNYGFCIHIFGSGDSTLSDVRLANVLLTLKAMERLAKLFWSRKAPNPKEQGWLNMALASLLIFIFWYHSPYIPVIFRLCLFLDVGALELGFKKPMPPETPGNKAPSPGRNRLRIESIPINPLLAGDDRHRLGPKRNNNISLIPSLVVCE